jgi:hypothetical protein
MLNWDDFRGQNGRNLSTRSPVTAVTDSPRNIGDTAIVIIGSESKQVRKALFEPGDTRQQWKGEAAASFV